MLSRVKRIGDGRTARMLMEDSPKRRLLLSFVPRARSVSEVAAAEGMTIGSAHHLILSFVRRGLLRVEREAERAGRPIKFYRAVASSYFLPLEFVSGSPGGGLARELRRRLDDELARSDEDGIVFDTDEEGQPRVSWFGDRRRTRAVGEFWQMPRLSEADAIALVRDMGALLDRYRARSIDGREYLVHAAVVPRRKPRRQ
jgi:hypothetical protein